MEKLSLTCRNPNSKRIISEFSVDINTKEILHRLKVGNKKFT